MRRLVGWLVSGVLTAALLPVLATEPALAGPDRDRLYSLGSSGFTDLLVDPTHDLVFVSTAVGGGTVFVRDHDGDAVGSITGLAGPTRMALTADGTMLYVLLTGTKAVAAISTTTLAVVGQRSLDPSSCLYNLAVSGTRLWFGDGCPGAPAGLGFVDLSAADFATAPVVRASVPSEVTLKGTPSVAVSAADPTRMVLSASGVPEAHIYLLDVVAEVPGLVAYRNTQHLRVDPVADLSFSPDGSLLASVTGRLFRATDLAASGSYVADDYSAGVIAVSAGAAIVARGHEGLKLFTRGGSLFRSVFWLSGGSDALRLRRDSLALSTTGDWLYAVTWSGVMGDPVKLAVIREPTKREPTMQISDPTSVRMDAIAVVRGRLSDVGTPPATVTIHRTSEFGQPLELEVPVNPDRTWSLSQQLTQRGVHRYTASWGGSSSFTGVAATTTVYVGGLKPVLTMSTNQPAGGFPYGSTVTVTAHLGTTHTLRTVTILRSGRSSPEVETPIGSGNVDAKGLFVVKSAATFIGSYIARFAGDDRYVPVKAYAPMERVNTVVYSRLYNYYATSGGYQLYHAKTIPLLGAAPAPWINTCRINFSVDRYSSTYGWQPYGVLYNQVPNSDGAAFMQLSLPRKVGDRFRIRAGAISNGYFTDGASRFHYVRITT